MMETLTVKEALAMHLPRTPFKMEMAKQLCLGLKWTTSRYRCMKQGLRLAICGSRYKPKPFGVFRVISAVPTSWQHIVRNAYDAEGFASPSAMQDYLRKERLVKRNLNDTVFLHELEFRKLKGIA